MHKVYDPKCDLFPYPVDTDKHYLKVTIKHNYIFDDKYPYIDKSFKFRFKCFLIRVVLRLIVFPYMRIRLGLRVKGKKYLRQYKKILKQGFLSCCNHVHMFDYLAEMYAMKPRKPHILSWKENINGEFGNLARLNGAIPIPEDDLKATKVYLKAIKDLLDHGGWLHINAEGSMWEYYQPIRPFKKGLATFSVKYNKPIVPMGFSYRKPGFIRAKIFKQIAKFTLTIGEPLFPDYDLPKEKQIEDMVIRSHEAVCRCAGIDPQNNLYPPLFSEEVKRIDYYTDTYGTNYKGSH